MNGYSTTIGSLTEVTKGLEQRDRRMKVGWLEDVGRKQMKIGQMPPFFSNK